MKTQLMMLVLSLFGVFTFASAQDDWKGVYTYQKGEGVYELEIYGPPGQLEGDFKYRGEDGSYKISLNLVEDGDFLKVEAVKIWEGKCPLEADIKKSPMMFRLTYVDDGVLITEVGSHTLGGFPLGHQDELFVKKGEE